MPLLKRKRSLPFVLLLGIFFALISKSIFASDYYFAPSLRVQQISANESRFRGLHIPLALGYGYLCGNNYMGSEIFLIPGTLTLSDTQDPGAASAKASTHFGVSLMPGRRLYKDLFGYGRIGLIESKFSSPNVWKWGTQLGVGLQKALSENWLIRGEYIYTIYGNVRTVGTPNSNELGVGLMYFFPG